MAAQLWPVLAGLLVLLGTNIHQADAGACKPASCASAGGNGIFKYQAGSTYTYNVEGTTLTDLPEQQGGPIQLKLKAVAEVNFGATCTNTLQLKNVEVTGPNAKVYGNLGELEKYAVRFSFNDGQLDPEICADSDDSNTALNIKRAVISLLQVSTPAATGTSSKTEVDVFGGCPTTFQITSAGAETSVTKSRNLNKCLYREALRNQVTTVNYAANSELQGSPLLDANLVVEMKVKGGVLHTASSHEVYLYRPFANKDAGAKTVAHTTITFKSKNAGPPHSCKGDAARSIIFDAPHDVNNDKSSVAAITAAMQACKESMPENVQLMAATEFRELVEVFRASKKDDLLTVYGQVKGDKASARKLYLDALFRAGTGDSVQAAVALLKSNEISGDFSRFWYMSFGFVRHATPEALSAAASLLDAPNAPLEAYLGIGALGSRYCGEHNCEGNTHYDELMAKLSKPLVAGCHCESFEEENKIIAALKGIENAKGMNEATAELIRVCMSNPEVPARVRIAALETARSDACQPQIKKTVIEMMADTQEDSEIRIKAYLTAVECPCGKCANAVKAMLDSEPVNQVGAFVVSHLRNIRASANPDKALQKQHLSEIRTTRKFPFDFRKFSQNYEVSGLLDALNIGSSIESNVIYSQRSFLPRSTSLNLTTEIFGHSVNLLEIGTRAENLDRLMAKWLGPRGYFKENTFVDIVENGKSKLGHIKDKLQQRLEKAVRGKRSVPVSALQRFRRSVNFGSDKNVKLDMNVKMFGSTVCHSSYKGDGQDFSVDSFIDKLFDRVDNGINKLKNFDYDVKHHALFYENEMSYPTGLGFPLKMTVVGSAAVHMKLSGKFDLHACIKDPKNTQLQLELVPSAAVEVTGLMAVDAYAVQAGLKLAAELHTSTGFNMNMKSLDGTGVDLTFGMPVKKQEIVNFKTEVLSSVKERGATPVDTAIGFSTKRKEFQGCFDQLSSSLGITLCSEVGVPFEGTTSSAALFPLNGPSKLSFSIQMDDVQAYRFKGHFNLKDENRKAIEFLVDTPNSQTNRKVEIVFEAISKPNYELRAKFDSPVKSAMAELVYVNTQKENSIAGRVLEDGKEYYAKLGSEVSGSPDHQVYKPSFEYRLPGKQSEKLVSKGLKGKGKAAKHQKAGETVDYHIEGTIVVDRTPESKKYTFNSIVLSTPIGKVSLNGNVGHEANSIYTDMEIQREKDIITIKGKGEKLGPKHFTLNGELQISTYPDLGFSVDWMYNQGDNQCESKLVVVHGHDLSSEQSCLTAHTLQKYHYNKETKDFGFEGKGSVTYPLLGVEAKYETKLSPNSASYEVKGKYDKYSVESEGHAKTGVQNPGDYDIEFEAKVLDSHVKFETKRDILSPHDSKFSTVLDMKPGGRYELTAETTCKKETNHVLSKLLAELKIEGNPGPHVLDIGMEANPAVFASHVKASIGSQDIVDLLAKVNKGSSPSGNFKAMVKDHLDGSGEFGYEAGKGALNGYIKLLKLHRMMKAEGSVAVTGSKHVGRLDVFFDESDPNKKICYEMDYDMKPKSVDAKHSLDVFGYKTILNYKGDAVGAPNDGTIKGSAELTLPTKHYFTGSLNHELHSVEGDANGAWKFEISAAEKKGGPARSLIIDTKANNCNRQNMLYDVDFNMVYKDLQGKDVKYNVASKHLHEGEKKHFEFLGQIEGSLLDMAPMVHVKVDTVSPVTNYYVKVNLAADSNLELALNYQDGSDGSVPYMGDSVLELNLPTGELKHMKVVENLHFMPGLKGDPCELKYSMVTTYNGVKTIKFDIDVKGSPEAGQGKLSLSLPQDELRVFKVTYHNGKGPDLEREGSITLNYGEKEGFVEMKLKVPQDKRSFHFALNGRSPSEVAKNFGVIIDSNRGESFVQSDVTVTANEKQVIVNSKYGLDWRNPLFEIGAMHPKGKSFIGFFFKQLDAITNHYQGELKYEHIGDTGYGKFDVVVPSVEDFTITVDADCAKLDINQIHLEIANKPGVKGGKSMTITQTEAGQPTINGKLNYKVSQGAEGTLFEASGNVQVRGESRQCKILFKKALIASPDENGFEYTVSTMLGDQSVDGLYKQTTKEIHFNLKGCKSAGACGAAEYLAKFTVNGVDFSNEVIANIDATGLGYTTDVGFERITYKKGMEFLHKVEFNNNKAQVVLFKIGFDQKAASICLITPSREMAVESTYSLVVDSKNKESIKYQHETNAWLDKGREPDVKATFTTNANYQRTGDTVTLSGESKFAHPSLSQPLVVKGTSTISGRQGMSTLIDIDVFAKKAQKVTIEGKYNQNQIANGYNYTSLWSVKSKGQKLDVVLEEHMVLSWSAIGMGSVLAYTDEKGRRDLGFGIEFTNNKGAIFVKSPKDMLVDVSMTFDMYNNLPSVEAFVSLLGCQGIVGKAYFEPGSRFIYYVHKKSTPNNKVVGEICMDFTTKLHHRVDWIHDGNTKVLSNIGFVLEDKVTPDFELNFGNMQALIEYLRGDLQAFVKQGKLVGKGLEEEVKAEMNDIAENLKKSQPNFKPIIAAYQKQLQTLREEMASAPGIQEMSDVVQQFVGSTKEIFGQVTEVVAKIADKLLDLFEEFSNTVLGSLKRFMPQVTDSCNKIFHASLDIFNALATQALNRLQDLVELCKKHEPELKQIGTAIAEMGRDVFQTIGKGCSIIFKEVKDFMTVIIEQVQALPVFTMMQEKMEEMKGQLTAYIPTEQIYNTLHETTKAIKDTLPTPELRDFVECLSNYFEKLMKKEKVDYAAEGKRIYQKGIAAFKSVIVLMREEMAGKHTAADGVVGVAWPISLKTLVKIPLAAAVHFSPIEFLKSDDLPKLSEFLITYMPRSLNPLDLFPPYKSYALVVDTTNFFTFDKRHFAFKGTCSYILVQDVSGGSLTVVLNLEKNGKLKSFGLGDGQDMVEYTAQGVLLMNGKPSEFPLKTPTLSAYRRYHTVVLQSTDGVELQLNMDYHVTIIGLSGFYHGRVRGLLGDSNYEEYDDFRLPNGQICSDSADLANAYAGGGSCTPGVAVPTQAQAESTCTALFSSGSSFSMAFSFFNPQVYRDACNSFVAGTTNKKQEYACRIAAAYVLDVRKHGFHIELPSSCAECTTPSRNFKVGEVLNVKVPTGMADVIFVVEQVTTNAEIYKELVVPLVEALTNELKSKKITDVSFSLIGYGHPKQGEPEHYTSNGKLGFDGKVNLEFGDAKTVTWGPTPVDKLAYFGQKFREEVGLTPFSKAMRDLVHYPWRVGASKTVILVKGTTCEKGLLIAQLRQLISAKVAQQWGVTVHVVSPVEGFNIVGSKDAKLQSSIVGFDAETVYSFADGKKKTIEGAGNQNQRSEIEYKQDLCIDTSQSTNGAAYNARNFLDAKGNQRKQFLQVMVNKLSQGLTKEWTEECSCSLYKGLYPETHCRVVASKESAPLRSQTEAVKSKKGGKKPKH